MPVADVGHQTSDVGLPFGLTGGIACGKSTVAGFFRDLGAHIVDADRVGHELIAPGQTAYQEIVERFGKDILDPEGRIDRKKLGPEVFADPPRLRLLNAILHPRIIARMNELVADQRRQEPCAVVILDAPLIFEAGMERMLHKVVVVWCRPEQQLERLVARAGVSHEEAERRIQSQMPIDEKRRRADYQIDCSGSIEHSRAQAETVYRKLEDIVAKGSR